MQIALLVTATLLVADGCKLYPDSRLPERERKVTADNTREVAPVEPAVTREVSSAAPPPPPPTP